MSGIICHPWNVTENEAKQIQLRLARLVVPRDDWNSIRLVGGVGVRPLDETTVQVGISVVDLASLEQMDSAMATAKSHLSYISGLRAFQAGPAIVGAFEQLHTRPELMLWGGHGLAHPRRCGIASHLGVLLDIPSVGVSEELVYGSWAVDALGEHRGSRVPVLDPEDHSEIGAAVRTQSHVRPVYVSVGHRVSLESAIRFVLECASRYRIPEPLRAARILCKRLHSP